MIQAVVTPEERGGLWYALYLSVPNIMKVIEPLFLNEFYEEFKTANMTREGYYKFYDNDW